MAKQQNSQVASQPAQKFKGIEPADNPGFVYDKLEGLRDFRLLQLKPAPQHDAPICVELQLSNLDKPDEYEALSYCWGARSASTQQPSLEGKSFSMRKNLYQALSYFWDRRSAETQRQVLVDGKPFSVRENLYQALVQLRHPRTSRLLYIDAICLDQGNTLEKNIQVPLMRDIYKEAKRVLCWLGPSTDTTEEGFRVFSLFLKDKLVDQAQQLQTRATLSQVLLKLNGDKRYETMDLDEELSEAGLWEQLEQAKLSLEAMHAILDRDWWYRVWVIQEFYFAKQVNLMCGSHTITLDAVWSNFTDEYRIMSLEIAHFCSNWISAFNISQANGNGLQAVKNQPEILSSIFKALRVTPNLVSHLHEFLNIKHFSARSKDTTFVFLGSRYLASDPRDYIYGLLGLPVFGLSVEVDYTMSVAETFTNATKQMFCYFEDCRLFCFLNQRLQFSDPDKVANLPSWSIDYSQIKRFQATCLSHTHDEATKHIFTVTGTNELSRFRTAIGDHNVIWEGSRMIIHAVYVDTLHKLQEDKACQQCSDSDVGGKGQLTQLRHGKGTSKHNHAEHQKSHGDMLPLLPAYEFLQHHFQEDTYIHTSEPMNVALLRTLLCDQETIVPGELRYDRLTQLNIPHEEVGLLNLLNNSDTATAVSIRYMLRAATTLHERFIANVAPEARPGDIIAVLAGGNVPYVLRPGTEIGEYELIGECYVHGIMDGEIFNGKRFGNITTAVLPITIV
jgi:hypothetical protein